MKKKNYAAIMIAVVVMFVGYNIYTTQNENTLSDLALANVEALAGGETGGVTHTLECGASGVKMCEAECGRCNTTLKAWGNGKTASLTCSRG